VRTAITNQAGAATVAGYMGYGPFGFLQYHAGQTGTNKGYTGQYNDPLSGLDYYVARYYDPVVGLFLSADTVEDNVHGMAPYAYVAGNPETYNDPTGHGLWDQFLQSIPQIIFAFATVAAFNPAGIAAFWLVATSVAILFAPPARHPVYNGPKPTPVPTPDPQKPSTNSAPSPTPSPAPSTDASGVGARCRNSQCRDLKYSENHGGHTLAQHVNVTPAQVIERAKLSHWYASMFTDFATAQWAVDQVLNSGTLPTKTAKGYWMFANVNVHKSIGIIWRPNGAVWGSTSYLTVLISPLTWTIETAYPSHPSIPIK